jgi:hypothetical protein
VITETNEKKQEKIGREVRLWCRIRNFPYELYQKLKPANKITFYKLTCQPASMTTNQQRKDLFDDLLSPGSHVAGRDSFNTQDLIKVDKKEEYFSPLTEKEKYDYFSKF